MTIGMASTISNAPITGEDRAALAGSSAEEHPAVQKIRQEVQDLVEKRQGLDEALGLPPRDRLRLLRENNRPLYDSINESVDQNLRSTAFRICAGTWLTGIAVSIGAAVGSFMGVVPSTLATLSLPSFLALGTGGSRLFLWGARKWIAPKKEDAAAQKCLTYYRDEIGKSLEKKQRQAEEIAGKISSENRGYVDAALQGREGDTIAREDEFVNIDGVKLHVNRRMELIVAPFVNKASKS